MFFIADNNKNIPIIDGGFCKNIFTTDKDKMFNMTYYSGSNKSMDKHFGFGNKVLRKLPDTYDYTNKMCDNNPKFAFNVLESKRSYTVTSDPIYGGTICYISTNTIEEAEKLKLFVLNNPYFKQYVDNMNIRGHAFALRNVKKFDLNQIQSGYEKPQEWQGDFQSRQKLEIVPDIYNLRYSKYELSSNNKKNFGEVFTPTELVIHINNKIEQIYADAFTTKTFLDPCCGNGQFLADVLYRKLENGFSHNESLYSIYGFDISLENVVSTISRLYKTDDIIPVIDESVIGLKYRFLVNGQLNKNFVCADATCFNLINTLN
jgi:hypothetical protein